MTGKLERIVALEKYINNANLAPYIKSIYEDK